MTDHTGVETPEPDDNEEGENPPFATFSIDDAQGRPVRFEGVFNPQAMGWPFGPQPTPPEPKPVPEPEPAFDMDAPSEIMVGAKQIKDMSLEELIDEATHHQRHFFSMMAKDRLMLVVANGRVSRYKERLCREMGSGFDINWNGED